MEFVDFLLRLAGYPRKSEILFCDIAKKKILMKNARTYDVVIHTDTLGLRHVLVVAGLSSKRNDDYMFCRTLQGGRATVKIHCDDLVEVINYINC